MRIAYEKGDDGIAVLTLDDGKANAMSIPWFEELGAALDRAETDAAGAHERGLVDGLAPSPEQALAQARDAAQPLAQLPRAAYAESKRRLRGPGAEQALARLAEEVRQ